jgi:peptidoglycan/LPS O-acetylase OafA/YrhL
LGRISYSLYLVHLIVLIGMIYLLAATLPLAVILIFAIFASLGVAHIIYRYVEAPSRSLGYRIAGCQLARVGPTALIYARKSFPSIIGDF